VFEYDICTPRVARSRYMRPSSLYDVYRTRQDIEDRLLITGVFRSHQCFRSQPHRRLSKRATAVKLWRSLPSEEICGKSSKEHNVENAVGYNVVADNTGLSSFV